jgi:hypothetical protein
VKGDGSIPTPERIQGTASRAVWYHRDPGPGKAQFTPDGRSIITIDSSRLAVRVWDAHLPQPSPRGSPGTRAPGTSPAGLWLVDTTAAGGKGPAGAGFTVRNARTGAVTCRTTLPVLSYAFDPTEDQLALVTGRLSTDAAAGSDASAPALGWLEMRVYDLTSGRAVWDRPQIDRFDREGTARRIPRGGPIRSRRYSARTGGVFSSVTPLRRRRAGCGSAGRRTGRRSGHWSARPPTSTTDSPARSG